jgi:hypothetical protein
MRNCPGPGKKVQRLGSSSTGEGLKSGRIRCAGVTSLEFFRQDLRTVDPKVGGSIPLTHPIWFSRFPLLDDVVTTFSVLGSVRPS